MGKLDITRIHYACVMGKRRIIITAASAIYGSSLLAMIGSLDRNWPEHPPLIVYDIGLDTRTLDALKRHGIEVRLVPAFCPHWRLHFTWKIWCWHEAPADSVLWLDAGLTVLRPLDEVFTAIDAIGYFACPNYEPINIEASRHGIRSLRNRPGDHIGPVVHLIQRLRI